MNTATALLLAVVGTLVLLAVLFQLVRAAVEQGVRRALRRDLLSPTSWELVEQRRQDLGRGGRDDGDR